MAEKYGFFNSSGGDRVYNAADFAGYFSKLVSNGIFSKTADNLKVAAASGMNLTVQAGSAWIDGYCYENTDPLTLTISTADGVNPRIDRVVLRWSAVDRDPKPCNRNASIFFFCISVIAVTSNMKTGGRLLRTAHKNGRCSVCWAYWI